MPGAECTEIIGECEGGSVRITLIRDRNGGPLQVFIQACIGYAGGGEGQQTKTRHLLGKVSPIVRTFCLVSLPACFRWSACLYDSLVLTASLCETAIFLVTVWHRRNGARRPAAKTPGVKRAGNAANRSLVEAHLKNKRAAHRRTAKSLEQGGMFRLPPKQ